MLLVVLGGPFAGSAWAASAGSDPGSNFTVGSLPDACQSAPTGAVCINASVNYLNQARASLGQPAYSLPSNFVSLSPGEQVLVLTNLDRSLYNLPPITGLTDALDQDAAAAVPNDVDPQPSTSDWYGYTANAAWGNENIVLAYEGWMYDDGPGSGNVDCTSSNSSGCWGHRHDILWEFGPGALAMGVAAGTDNSGNPSYTQLLMQGSPSYSPVYNYTWSQALANGAGGARNAGTGAVTGSTPTPVNASSSGVNQRPVGRGADVSLRIRSVRVRGHRITVSLVVPSDTGMRCSLTRSNGRLLKVKACGRSLTFRHIPAGRYQLRITAGAASASRRVLIP